MNRTVVAVAAGLGVAGLGLSSLAPAHAIVGPEYRSPRLLGGGWVGIGDPNIKVHVQANLPCGAVEVGFKPQPDPPGRLHVHWGDNRFRLTAVDGSGCSLGWP